MMSNKCSIFQFLFFLASFPAFAQDTFKEKETYSFTLNTINSTIKFDVMAKKEFFNANKALTYYWYSTNKILETHGGYEGKLLNGRYACFYLNSNLKEKGKFKKGLKDGEWVYWFENGKIMEVVTWHRGVKSGSFRSYDEIGEPVLEAEYRDGKLNGKMITYQRGKISDTHIYKNDKEIEPRPKKVKKAATTKNATETSSVKTKKKTLKERWTGLFDKKSKDEKDTPKAKSTTSKKKRKWFHKADEKKKENPTTPNSNQKQ